ncbi:YndM family protein [Virgibacillus sp. DJP39]|uniref:YndM family protein n=1 Tax=Virgibacillus sp. DJP39 TaxID=3409790 RepID=UPI003BB6E298
MKHIKAIGIKFIFTAIVVYSIFGIFYDASLLNLFWISTITTGLSYIGDVFILPKIGNLIASVADFGLSFFLLWVLGNVFIDATLPIITASLFASVFMAISESLFHIYMEEKVLDRRDKEPAISSPQLQTEFSEETNKETIKEDEKNNKDK